MKISYKNTLAHLTPFSERVYDVVRKIPKGQTRTYGEVARLAGRPKASRAVGNILNKNKDPRVPCHRVIRADGKVGGYGMGGTVKKARILKEEGAR